MSEKVFLTTYNYVGKEASATAIERILTSYRNRVIVAPTGNYGSIIEVVMRKAGSNKVSDTDARSLVEFWKQIYDIYISPEEIPLLKVKTSLTHLVCAFLLVAIPLIYRLAYRSLSKAKNQH